MARLSHLSGGKAAMVDVGGKAATRREAVALGEVGFGTQTGRLLETGTPKGDVLAAARLAGIMAAKKTSDIIPLCHPLRFDFAEVAFRVEPRRVLIKAVVRCEGKTGVEMEALTAVSAAALTIYDMLKSADRAMTIGPILLAVKSGGRSGLYVRPGAAETLEGPWR